MGTHFSVKGLALASTGNADRLHICQKGVIEVMDRSWALHTH